MSEEQKAEIRRKLTIGENEDLNRNTRAGWTRFSGFTVVPQETTWNCGPAAVQSAIQYINGYADKQSNIAKALGTNANEGGTYMPPILKYMNEKQNRNQYVAQSASSSIKAMKYAFTDSVIDFEAPTIISVKVESGVDINKWGFSSDGHYILITGVYNGGEKVEVSDVNGENLGIGDKRDLDVSVVHKAIQLKDVGYLF